MIIKVIMDSNFIKVVSELQIDLPAIDLMCLLPNPTQTVMEQNTGNDVQYSAY